MTLLPPYYRTRWNSEALHRPRLSYKWLFALIDKYLWYLLVRSVLFIIIGWRKGAVGVGMATEFEIWSKIQTVRF